MKLIPLSKTGKKNKGRYFAQVDDDMFDYLNNYNWSIDAKGYPQKSTVTNKGFRPVRMHRFILGLVGMEMADHINGNKLDHTLKNLRKCTNQQNICNQKLNIKNTTGYKGVFFCKKSNRYHAHITRDGNRKFLGSFATKEQAALAYDRAAKMYFGEFANINFKCLLPAIQTNHDIFST